MTDGIPPPRSRVHLIGCDAPARDWIAQQLQPAIGTLVGHATSEAFLGVLAEVARARPACAIVDFEVQRLDALGLQRRLTEHRIGLPQIFLFARGDLSRAIAAMRGGAFDVIEKPGDPRHLREAVMRALAIDRPGPGPLDDRSLAQQRVALLSRRETQVLRGMLGGMTNKAMAHLLGLSVRTVEDYRARLMEKIGAGSLADAIRLAFIAEVEPLTAQMNGALDTGPAAAPQQGPRLKPAQGKREDP